MQLTLWHVRTCNERSDKRLLQSPCRYNLPASRTNNLFSIFLDPQSTQGPTSCFIIPGKYPHHICITHTINGCTVTPARLHTMLTRNLEPSLFLLISWLSFNYLPLVSGRVLVRPSASTLLPYNKDSTSNQYAPQLLDRSFHQPRTTNVTTSRPDLQ